MNRVDHDYKVGDKVILNNSAAYKYETPYNGPFVIAQCWTNGMGIFQCDAIKIRHNIHRILCLIFIASHCNPFIIWLRYSFPDKIYKMDS